MSNSMEAYFCHTLTDPMAYGDKKCQWLDFAVRRPGQPEITVLSGLQFENGLSPCSLVGFGHLAIGAHLYISTIQPFVSRQHYFAISGEVLRWHYNGDDIDEVSVLTGEQTSQVIDEALALYNEREQILQ